MNQLKFLVVGDVCLDKFVYGRVDRLSPESPCAILNPIETHQNLGMAGNVLENLRCLAKEHRVDCLSSSSNKINTKTRYVDKKSGYILLRVDENDSCEPLTQEKISNADISSYDCVVISDYNKGTLNDEAISNIASQAKLSFIDTKKVISPLWADKVSYIKINELEYQFNCKHGVEFDPKQLVLTLGEKGIQYDGKVYPAQKVEVSSVVGAGDTIMTVLAYEYTRTKDIVYAIEQANYYAGIAVSKRGVVSDIYE